MKSIDFLGIIPARYGSKGVPQKNIKLLGSKPLIYYTIDDALQSKYLNEIILSTDSEIIRDICKSKRINIPFLRPANLASDTASSIDVVKHCLNHYKLLNIEINNIVLLQPTYPFRFNDMIDKAIESYIKFDADSLISVLRIPDKYNPHWAFEHQKNGYLKISTGEENIITRRQDLPPAYFRDGAIYISSTKVIYNKNSFYGDRLIAFENDSSTFYNIDTPEDWQKAEEFLKAQHEDLSGNKL